MKILIINIVIAIGLTGWALAQRRSRAARIFCVILLLAIPLYLTIGWMAGYRAVVQPSREKMELHVSYRDAWFEGVFAMHRCTLERYVPEVLPYLVALGILALIPCQKKEKSQPAA